MGATEIIPGNTLVRTEVTLQNTKDKTKEKKKKLLVDTGVVYTVIDLDNAKSVDGTPKPIEGDKKGDNITITDVSMLIEVEDRSGNVKTLSCDKMRARKFEEERVKQFQKDGIEGILGMDQLDTICAYPKKSPDGKKAFLLVRPPAKKENK
jgi:hypothetical protein